MTASLYIVATPIGNLGDMTLRGLETLRQVDLIAAEDTRHSAKLLAHFDIRTPMVSYHDHSTSFDIEQLLGVKNGLPVPAEKITTSPWFR